jgi:phospholipid-binding lipoprotein MlaA
VLLTAAVALALSSAPAAVPDAPGAAPVSAQAPAPDAAPDASAPAPAASPAPQNVLHAPAASTLVLGSTATAEDPLTGEGPAGTAAPPGSDPFQRMNRSFFRFNDRLDSSLFGPTARTYKRSTPGPFQSMLHNFVTNFGEPVVLANDMIQLRPKAAMTTAFRFIVNSTAGIGGLFDPAKHAGAPHHDNDFGITLGRYGCPPGPYLYIPLMGPSSIRDAMGAAVDGFLIDPWNWAGWVKELEPANPPKRPFPYYHHHDAIPNRDVIRIGAGVLGAIDERARVDADLAAMMSTATDPYATMRSVYLQNRAAQVDQSHWRHTSLPEFETPADTSPAAAAAAAAAAFAAAASSATAASAATATPPATVAPAAAETSETPAKAVLPARN